MKNRYTLVLIVMLLLGTYVKAQVNFNYDVGVFYMPFWDQKNSYPSPSLLNCTTTTLNVDGENVEKYTNCSGVPGTGLSTGVPGHWNIMYDYNNFLTSKYAWSDIRVPDNLYWPSPQWYDESWKHVAEKQHELMASNGINFVVYDSFFEYNDAHNQYFSLWSHAMKNRLKPGFDDSGVDFAIFWTSNKMLDLVRDEDTGANRCASFFRGEGLVSGAKSGLEKLAEDWSQYMKRSDYKKIDGKPVLYIQVSNEGSREDVNGFNNSIEGICDFCRNDDFFPADLRGEEQDGTFKIQNEKHKYFLEQFEAALARRGVPTPLYKVAVIDAHPSWDWYWANDISKQNNFRSEWLIKHPEKGGYQATTAYHHFFYDYNELGRARSWDGDKNCGNNSYDYTYSRYSYNARRFKDYSLSRSQLDYQIPVSAGWNRASHNYKKMVRDGESIVGPTPSNLYKEYKDCAISTPDSWESELVAAKNRADQNVSKTDRRIVLCCWNEYHEGTVIEPTTTFGDQYLKKVKSVFEGGGSSGGITPKGALKVKEEELEQEVLGLEVFPNPIKDFASIRFNVESEEEIVVDLLDVAGRKITNIEKETFTPGVHEVKWKVSGLQGVYFLRLRSHAGDDIKRILIE